MPGQPNWTHIQIAEVQFIFAIGVHTFYPTISFNIIADLALGHGCDGVVAIADKG